MIQKFYGYGEFSKRKDITINGYSEGFLKLHGLDKLNEEELEKVLKEQDKNNVGCWNCFNCEDCLFCQDSRNLISCIYCEYGNDSKNCLECYAFSFSSSCGKIKHCYKCTKCFRCTNCSNCKSCGDCINLENENSRIKVDIK